MGLLLILAIILIFPFLAKETLTNSFEDLSNNSILIANTGSSTISITRLEPDGSEEKIYSIQEDMGSNFFETFSEDATSFVYSKRIHNPEIYSDKDAFDIREVIFLDLIKNSSKRLNNDSEACIFVKSSPYNSYVSCGGGYDFDGSIAVNTNNLEKIVFKGIYWRNIFTPNNELIIYNYDPEASKCYLYDFDSKILTNLTICKENPYPGFTVYNEEAWIDNETVIIYDEEFFGGLDTAFNISKANIYTGKKMELVYFKKGLFTSIKIKGFLEHLNSLVLIIKPEFEQEENSKFINLTFNEHLFLLNLNNNNLTLISNTPEFTRIIDTSISPDKQNIAFLAVTKVGLKKIDQKYSIYIINFKSGINRKVYETRRSYPFLDLKKVESIKWVEK